MTEPAAPTAADDRDESGPACTVGGVVVIAAASAETAPVAVA